MSQQLYGNADPAGLFAVACPGCAAEIGVRASRMGSAARCPVCRGLFLVPEPRLPPVAPTAALAVERVAGPPSVEPRSLEAASLEAPSVEPSAVAGPLPALAPPPPPPGAAVVAAVSAPVASAVSAPMATAFDDLELPPATVSSELALEEPVRTVEAGGRVIALRRISEDERRRRKTRRTIVILVVGSAILAGLAWVLGGLDQR